MKPAIGCPIDCAHKIRSPGDEGKVRSVVVSKDGDELWNRHERNDDRQIREVINGAYKFCVSRNRLKSFCSAFAFLKMVKTGDHKKMYYELLL